MSAAPKVIKASKMVKTDFELSHDAPNAAEVREKVCQQILSIAQMVTKGDDQITVRYVVGDKTTQFFIECPRQYIGYLIGSQGSTINAIRTILRAMMGIQGLRGVVEVPYYDDK